MLLTLATEHRPWLCTLRDNPQRKAKLAAVRETTPEPSLLRCGQKLVKKRKEREMYHLLLGTTDQPNVFVGVLRRREVRGLPGGVKDNATHHIRVGAKVPPPAKTG